MSETRILPEDLPAAYRELGIIPGRYQYFAVLPDSPKCSCGMGVMAQANGIRPYTTEITEWSYKKYGAPYHIGYIRGFDGRTDIGWKGMDQDKARYEQGMADGQAGAALIFSKLQG